MRLLRNATGTRVSDQTVQNRLHSARLKACWPYVGPLTLRHRQERPQWALANRCWSGDSGMTFYSPINHVLTCPVLTEGFASGEEEVKFWILLTSSSETVTVVEALWLGQEFTIMVKPNSLPWLEISCHKSTATKSLNLLLCHYETTRRHAISARQCPPAHREVYSGCPMSK